MTDVMTDAELVKKALSYATIGTQGEVALQLAGNAVRVTREAYESRIQSLTADLDRAKEALGRQTDNMTFLLNRTDVPDEWYSKFSRCLTEDILALKDISHD